MTNNVKEVQSEIRVTNLKFKINSWTIGIYGGETKSANIVVTGRDNNLKENVSANLCFYKDDIEIREGSIGSHNGKIEATAFFSLDVFSETVKLLHSSIDLDFFIRTDIGVQGSGVVMA
jgi:hypothetical protein